MPAEASQSDNPHCFAMQDRSQRRGPLATFQRTVARGYPAHRRKSQSDGEFGGADRIAAGCLGHDYSQVSGRLEVDVVGMIAGLGDDPEAGQSFQKFTGERRALAVGDKGVEPAQNGGLSERAGEDSYFGTLAKPFDRAGRFIGPVYVVENRYPHGLKIVPAAPATGTAARR